MSDAEQFPGIIQADCNSCAAAILESKGGWLNTEGWFMGHPSMYSLCGNKRCPCAAHHDNPCTGSNEPGQPGSLYRMPSWRTALSASPEEENK